MESRERLAQAMAAAIELKQKKDPRLTKRDIADAFGVSVPSVVGWEKTGRIAKKRLPQIIEYFADVVPASHFGEALGLMLDDVSTNAMVTVPQLNVYAGMGKALPNEDSEEVVREINVSEQWIRRNIGNNIRGLRLITGNGDSMTPTIHNGDIVFVDTAVVCYESEGVYVLADGNGVRIKRLHRLFDGSMKIISDNKLYTDEMIAPDSDVVLKICGKVVAVATLQRV